MQRVTCGLCPIRCSLSEGQAGACKVRANVGGVVKLTTYGKITTAILGQVEQKPFYHYEPGMSILSIGSMGCNMRCGFCQNFEISQGMDSKTKDMSPKDVVRLALDNGAKGIAFTYNEPIVWFEYVMDVCSEARGAGLGTLLKTNGYADLVKFAEMAENMSAINIDIKGDASDYNKTCGVNGEAEDYVMKNLATAFRLAHVEVSVILAPPISIQKTKDLLIKARSFCGRQTALHLLRFIPDFKMKDKLATTTEEMQSIRSMAKELFDYPYIHGMGSQNTECLNCGEIAVRRDGEKCVGTSLGDDHISYDPYYTCPACRMPLPVRSAIQR